MINILIEMTVNLMEILLDERHYKACVPHEREQLCKLKSTLRDKTIILIEGAHSPENVIYKRDAPSTARGILSISESLEKMGMGFHRVTSTHKNLKEYLSIGDFAFIYAHGEYGEDGRIQGWCDYLNLIYPGSGVSGSAICCDKLRFKYLISGAKIATADFREIEERESFGSLKKKAETLGFPVMVKDRTGGSSIGITYISDVNDLRVWHHSVSPEKLRKYFMEKFVGGKFVTIGIIKMSKGYYVLPILSAKTSALFYDAETKMGNRQDTHSVEYDIGGGYDLAMQAKLKSMAWEAFQSTGCEGIGRVDFIVEGNNPFVLEINTIPGISNDSNFTKMFRSLGFDYDELVLAVMNSAYLKNQSNSQDKS
ncbi:D-alanine--D-alanine ligase family protein [Burkholderia cenocepacia]